MPGQTHQLVIGGEELEVLRFPGRQPDAPTLVLLHEGLGCVAAWKDFPQRLSERSGYPVMVYSRAGYGKSSVRKATLSSDFMHIQALDSLPQLLQKAGVRHYVLVGHSDGGSIALIHAGAAPRPGLQGIVTLAPHVFVEQLTVDSIRALAESYPSNDVLRSGLARQHGEKTDAVFGDWSEVWLAGEFRRWNIEGYLSTIGVPHLLIQGRDDQYGTLAQVESIIRNSIRTVHALVLENCQHSPFRDQEQKTLKAVVAFLGEL